MFKEANIVRLRPHVCDIKLISSLMGAQRLIAVLLPQIPAAIVPKVVNTVEVPACYEDSWVPDAPDEIRRDLEEIMLPSTAPNAASERSGLGANAAPKQPSPEANTP